LAAAFLAAVADFLDVLLAIAFTPTNRLTYRCGGRCATW
jgi:hypothetical protein